MTKAIKVCLFGAAPDTGNLGVSALFTSTASALAARTPLDLHVFDFGQGVRPAVIQFDGRSVPYQRYGAKNSMRLYSRDSLWNMRISARFGGIANAGARAIATADAVMDLSGGDSFTDLYGAARYRTIYLPKLIALERRIPLVLLPQTYGPFRTIRTDSLAGRIVRGAAQAWARDARSFAVLQELAGAAFDPQRHLCGVDMAFGLEPRMPRVQLPSQITTWISERKAPLIGINISGLIYNEADLAAARYGLKANYRDVVHQLVSRILRETNANVILVPHVLRPVGTAESDCAACAATQERLGATAEQRVHVVPPILDERESKWLIARCDWFCGTRMHSTVASLSSGVPSAAIAYSHKTLGVFESCGQGEHVADPRLLDSSEVVKHVWQSCNRRDETRRSLARHVPAVLERVAGQMDQIIQALRLPACIGACA